jgi:hypothetical protein
MSCFANHQEQLKTYGPNDIYNTYPENPIKEFMYDFIHELFITNIFIITGTLKSSSKNLPKKKITLRKSNSSKDVKFILNRESLTIKYKQAKPFPDDHEVEVQYKVLNLRTVHNHSKVLDLL